MDKHKYCDILIFFIERQYLRRIKNNELFLFVLLRMLFVKYLDKKKTWTGNIDWIWEGRTWEDAEKMWRKNKDMEKV